MYGTCTLFAVRYPYVDFIKYENQIYVSYLQPKFTKVSTECVKRKQ